MMNFKKISLLLFVFFVSISSLFAANVYNKDGHFTVTVDDQRVTLFNDDIKTDFNFQLKNKDFSDKSRFYILVEKQGGWDIDLEEGTFVLEPGETKEIGINFKANSNFDYSRDVVSQNLVKISQIEDYEGTFEFPISIYSDEEEEVSLNYNIRIIKREEVPASYDPELSDSSIGPINPLQFSVKADNVKEAKTIEIKILMNGEEIKTIDETFNEGSSYKIYTHSISSDIEPGTYPFKILVRVLNEDGSTQEWSEEKNIEVGVYNNLREDIANEEGLFTSETTIYLENNGNQREMYEKSIDIGNFKRIFFLTGSNYENTESGVTIKEELGVGQNKTISYGFNYLSIYLLVLAALILLTYIYVRKSSNPLDVETKLYEIKKVAHEGVKSIKIRIGFENIKIDEIDDLKLIFRMPSYLQVEESSFSMAPPKHVLKGKNQYKLIWEFKRFEKNESRILGFSLINTRGILGDIKLPDIEFEVKVNGKIKKYYEAFPLIKG